MQIICKGAIEPSQLESRKQLNIPVELQLLPDFETVPVEKAIQIVKDSGVDVAHVHSPLYPDKPGNIEYINISTIRQGINYTMELAGELSKHFKHTVTVVVHLGISSTLVTATGLYRVLADYFFKWLNKYPLVDVAVESLLLFDKFGGNCNIYNEHIAFVNQLNNEYGIKANRIGTVLDVCHAKATIRAVKEFMGRAAMTMDDYYKVNADVVKLIHLADCRGYAIAPADHGIAFENVEDMKVHIDLYNKYGYTCPIVLEVKEIDYDVPLNLTKNYKMLRGLI